MNTKLLIIPLIALIAATSCTTIDPVTGERVYDPVTTAQVKDALAPAISQSITSWLKTKDNADAEAYIRAVGTVFCTMQAQGTFDYSMLTREIDKIVADRTKLPEWAIAVKNSSLILFSLFSSRHVVELPKEKWPAHVADLFCRAIDTGLKDAGKPGVPLQPTPTP